MRVMRTLALSLVLSSALFACGGAEPTAKEPTAPPASVSSPPTTTAAAVPEKTTQLKRSRVKAAIGRGVGALLRHVSFEDNPEFRNDKFYGFKIKAVDPEWGVDLQPGDVIVRVNGIVIERPEHADTALRALEKAPSLKVEYERAGKQALLELPIVED
jgi:type II secretory pathway component PulC